MIIIVTIIRNLFMVIYIFQHYTFIMIVFIHESIYFIASFLLKFLKKNYISHPVNYIYIYIYSKDIHFQGCYQTNENKNSIF